MKNIFTSESVGMGHPDKTCDLIADSFLDEALIQDKNSQMAVECAIKNDKLFIYGESTTKAKIDYEKIAKEVLQDVGYTQNFTIIKEISEQSPDIRGAVIKNEFKANDQGMVFGYATNETKEFMPLPIMVSHKLMKKFDEYRRENLNYHSDAKCEVSVEYDDDGKPVKFVTIVLSVSHESNISNEQIDLDMKENVILPILSEYDEFNKGDIKFLINTSGKFTIWGSFGDSGCVGRKIIVDSYGGMSRVGGGCFSSKNATKVDRSGAYYARFVAKNVVAHGLADRCEIQVSYAIGLAKPIGMFVETFGTNKLPKEEIENFITENFDFDVNNIISELGLLNPIYKKTACFGHFGWDSFPWEKIKDIK